MSRHRRQQKRRARKLREHIALVQESAHKLRTMNDMPWEKQNPGHVCDWDAVVLSIHGPAAPGSVMVLSDPGRCVDFETAWVIP